MSYKAGSKAGQNASERRRLRKAQKNPKRCPKCGYVGNTLYVSGTQSQGTHATHSLQGARYCKHCQRIFYEKPGQCNLCGSEHDVQEFLICRECLKADEKISENNG